MSLAELAHVSTWSEDTLVDLHPTPKLQPRRAVLIVLEGVEPQQTWVIDRDAMVVGREPACPISLRDPTSSRRHAMLRYSEPAEDALSPTVLVEDLGSTNGTIVNGERIAAPRMLREHDRIRIGATMLAFEFRDVRELAAEEELRQMAMTDPLTGLYNRGVFDREFQREFDRCRRYGRPFSLILVDLDHFKQINDRYGHMAGDRVLREVSRTLQSTVRETDTVARYGGEEFAVILPETPSDGAELTGERLRVAVSRMALENDGAALPVTASVGVASIDPHHADSAAMLAAADRALYRAKDRGRNRTCVWKPPRRDGG